MVLNRAVASIRDFVINFTDEKKLLQSLLPNARSSDRKAAVLSVGSVNVFFAGEIILIIKHSKYLGVGIGQR